jgi:hypothetical protein
VFTLVVVYLVVCSTAGAREEQASQVLPPCRINRQNWPSAGT